jgi:hypothetical protein
MYYKGVLPRFENPQVEDIIKSLNHSRIEFDNQDNELIYLITENYKLGVLFLY